MHLLQTRPAASFTVLPFVQLAELIAVDRTLITMIDDVKEK